MIQQVIFRARFPLDQVAAPISSSASEGTSMRSLHAVERWNKLFGPEVLRVADPEDWHENATWLFAALETGLPVVVMYKNEVVRVLGADKPIDGAASIVVGTFLKNDPLLRDIDQPEEFRINAELKGFDTPPNVVWPRTGQDTKAARYERSNTFLALAGRFVAPATFAPDTPSENIDVRNVLAFMALHGSRAACVKIMSQAKYSSPERIELAAGFDEKAADQALFKAFEYALVHLEGQPGAFLVQDWVEMLDEYRIVVIDGTPVCGAACIEAYSPPFNEAADFDVKVEGKRGSGAVRRDVDLIERYRGFSAHYASRAAQEGILDYTLDLARDPDGKILVVETNPLRNFGLYAMNVAPAIEAIVKATIVK